MAALVAGGWTFARAEMPDQIYTVSAVNECVDSDSLEVANVDPNNVRFACLQSKGVQRTCGADGRSARLNAFRQWMARLDQYQRQCDRMKGTFSFKSPDFEEPRDESYCSEATIDVTYGAFENPICHLTSKCPAVQVVCSFGATNESNFKIPPQAIALPGVPIPINVH